ncbi:MAG: FAD-dependent oxidoreductase [Bacteroidia bacterium]|nr:FAD-binding oxidoreductase [Bacteroidia bacterium]MDW8157739.1 FAD-dependent oxidoreductase [Bacteroidia bacterium]
MRIIIIGGGLAGTLLGFQLAREGVEVHLFGDPSHGAWRVAAGLFNTITGLRAAKTWKALELVETLHKFYTNYPEFKQFIHWKPIYRPFKNYFEVNEWSVKVQTDEFDFVEYCKEPLPHILNPLGGILIKNTGYVEVAPLVEKLQAVINQLPNASIIPSALEEENIDPIRNRIIWQKQVIYYDYLVFANGLAVLKSKIWQNLPIIPLKGELAFFEVFPEFRFPYIISAQKFLLPLSSHTILVGSTYERYQNDELPTKTALIEFENFLRQILAEEFEFRCIKQIAGVRASTPDRRPIIGPHPYFSNIFIFNGLGTKGVLLAFHFSLKLKEVLLKSMALDKEVVVSRFNT